MQLNWFVILVQIFNFLILLFILKKVLYKPILDFLEKRRGGIEMKIRDAEKAITDGEARIDEYNSKIARFEEDKKKRQGKLVSDLAREKEKGLKEVRSELKKERETVSKQLVKNREKLIENVNKVIAKKFIKFAESVFGTLASDRLESEMVSLFVTKLQTLGKKEVLALNNSIAKHKGLVQICTAFSLKKNGQKTIKDALAKIKIKYKKIEFGINSDLIIGVELKVANSYVTWNVREILKDLKTELE